MGIGFKEILVILLIVVLLFGARRIPELMKGLGRGVREFKEGLNPNQEDKKDNQNQDKKVN